MLALINNEHNKDFMIAVYGRVKGGFQVQLIDHQTLVSDDVLPDAQAVADFGKAYGFHISAIELGGRVISKTVRFEDQSAH